MHYLSILAILKNEAMNLKVWIDHYLWQGVDHLYLIDNGSDDNSVAIIKDLILLGYPITLYELPERYKQKLHYQYVYRTEHLQEATKWLIVADLDEFFYCLNSTIPTELKKYEEYDHILSQWRMFGSNGLVHHPEDIRTAFTTRVEQLNATKYIFQTKNIDSEHIDAHFLLNNVYQNSINLSDVFRLNHYPIQSIEYYEKVKMTRGDATGAWANNIRDWGYFNSCNEGTTYVDEDLKNMVNSKT